MTTIEVHELTKVYGSTTAVDRVTFTVRPGIVTGFLGPNGAGKSTTMRMILGLDRPTSGTATIGGLPFARAEQPLTLAGALLDASAPTRHGPRATTCSRSRRATGCRRTVSEPFSTRSGCPRSPPGVSRPSRSVCVNVSGLPPRCSATREC